MKNIIFLLTVICPLFCLTSCKKDQAAVVTSVEVVYKISPIDPLHQNWITSLTYHDENESNLTVSDLSTFKDGILKITTAKKPFTAYISTTMNNTSPQAFNYTLTILVNGVTKVTDPVNAPAMSPSLASCQYTVQ